MTKPKDEQAIAIHAMKGRIENERIVSKRDLLSSIEYLTIGLKRAKEALEKGEHVDAHLIANAAMMTESIARWNTALELAPFIAHWLAAITKEPS